MLSLSDIYPTHSASMVPLILSSSPCQHDLLGEYYQDVNPKRKASAAHLGQSPSVLAYLRVDDNIDFSWGHGPADPNASAGLSASAGFSIRWTGFLQMPPYGWPQFETVRDDGLRFYINGTLVIDAWNNSKDHTDTSSYYEYAPSLSPVPIKLEYYENGTPPATVRLRWYDYSQSNYVPIPSQSFYNGSPPAKPSLSAQPGDGHVLLSWQPPAGANENTSYNLLRSVNGNNYALLTATASTSYDDLNLTNGTLYAYIVVAVCPCGSSDASDVVSARPVPPVPNSPTGLTATAVSKTEIDLTWGALAGVNGYSLERSPDGVSSWAEVASQTQNSFPDTRLTTGTTYYYRVRAWRLDVGVKTYSSYSNTAHAMTPPDAPVLSASTAGGHVSLSWTAVRNAVSYNLYRSSISRGESLYRTELTGQTFVDTGVVGGHQYFYQITAVVSGPDGAIEGDRSNEVQTGLIPCILPGLDAQQGLTLSPISVVGGTMGGGLVTLTSPALSGGQVVTLSSSNSLATVPDTVLVPSGSTIAAFLFKTRAVTAPASVMIAASTHGSVARQTLTVVPLTPIPQVPAGGSATFPAIGSDNPPASSANTWEIVDPDGVTVLAGDATGTNGWNATRDAITNDLTVYAPWGSGGKKNYEVRFRDQVASLTSAYFDVLYDNNWNARPRAKATPRLQNAELARLKASSKH